MTYFDSLPPEIIEQVASKLSAARDVSSISKLNRKTHEVVKRSGWRAFTQSQFPSFKVPSAHLEAAQALTALSRSFDRRAFFAEEFAPSVTSHALPHNGWAAPNGEVRAPAAQTMGYQAVVDSYEEENGDSWLSRECVVAWGAGAELIVNHFKSEHTLITARKTKGSGGKDPNDPNKSIWMRYREKYQKDGIDDITSVNILRPPHRFGHQSVVPQLIVGRASGELCAIRASPDEKDCIIQRYNTFNIPVRSADVSPGSTSLLATALGDNRLVIHPLPGRPDASGLVQQSSDTSCIPAENKSSRTWTTKFLSDNKVAVGLGPSPEVVHVYSITPSGISQEPLRKFGHGKRSGTSAYPIEPLPGSMGSKAGDNVLISGMYDGTIRYHDLRSPLDSVATLRDPVDTSAVYSLCPVGRERLIAGASTHSLLKVFDLRMAGGRVYSYLDAAKPSYNITEDRPVDTESKEAINDSNGIYASGFNIFVGSNRQPRSSRRRQPRESPIYSLSRPSPCSPTLYVGMENAVTKFSFASVMDPYPDPVLQPRVRRTSDGRYSAALTWFLTPNDGDMCGDGRGNYTKREVRERERKEAYALTLYEQLGKQKMYMRYQRNLGHQARFDDVMEGYDERLSRISTGTSLRSSRAGFG